MFIDTPAQPTIPAIEITIDQPDKVKDLELVTVDDTGVELASPLPVQPSEDGVVRFIYPNPPLSGYIVILSKDTANGLVLDAARYRQFVETVDESQVATAATATFTTRTTDAPAPTVQELVTQHTVEVAKAPAMTAELSVSAGQSVEAGTRAPVTLQHITKGTTLTVAVDGKSTDETIAIPSDAFTANVQIPAKTRAGQHTLTLTTDTGESAQVSVLVRAARWSLGSNTIRWTVIGLVGLLALVFIVRRRRSISPMGINTPTV